MTIQPFSLLLGSGASLGLAWSAWQAPIEERGELLRAGLSVLAGAVLGGRAYAVWQNWSYYRQYPLEALEPWRGGYAWSGALLFSVLTLALYSKVKRKPFGRLADRLAPLLLCAAAGAWLGCWFQGCAYGLTSDAWWALPARDEWGRLDNRLPVQLLGALLAVLVLWLGERLSLHKPALPQGALAALSLLALSLQILVLSYLRLDPAPFFQGLRLEAWEALGAGVFASLWLVILFVRK